MSRDYRQYLDDILDAISKLERYTKGINLDQFRDDDKTVDAVIRNFTVIGEAAKHIPLSFRKKYPDIPWKEMAGMRDILVHEYFGVRFDILWVTMKKRLPQVKPMIEAVLRQMEEEIGKG